MVLIPGTSQLAWSGQYRYLKIAQVTPPASSLGQIVAGRAYELGPEGLTSSTPLGLKLSYDPAGLPPGVREVDLYLGWWNASASAWDRVDATLEAAENCLVGDLDHFSTYAVVGPRPPATTAVTSTTSITVPVPSSYVPAATPPAMVVITASPQAAGSPSPLGGGGITGLRGAVYALAPPVAVLVAALAACAVMLRWMR